MTPPEAEIYPIVVVGQQWIAGGGAILDPREGLGAGLAYSTSSDQLLLNVPARSMSALEDRPAHFLIGSTLSIGLAPTMAAATRANTLSHLVCMENFNDDIMTVALCLFCTWTGINSYA